MKNNVLPERIYCPYCNEIGCLRYWKEADGRKDYYYCQKSYNLVEWDGSNFHISAGEAYPDRNKLNQASHL